MSSSDSSDDNIAIKIFSDEDETNLPLTRTTTTNLHPPAEEKEKTQIASQRLHITNLVRPFTLAQLKGLLSTSGTFDEGDLWLDPLRSHCYVTFSSLEMAQRTVRALHGLQWPKCSPSRLNVEYVEEEEKEDSKKMQSFSLLTKDC